MNQGRTLSELAAEIMRRETTKRDFIVPTTHMTMSLREDGKALGLTVPTGGEFGINEHAHDQIGTYLDIPSKHYDRLRGAAPQLLANEVNHFMPLMREKDGATPQNRMLRTLDGSARALVSNRYRRLDYFDMLTAILPSIMGDKSLIIQSCEVTDTKMYLKVVRPSLEAEIVKGDPVQAGFVVSNSEIGMGSVNVKPFLLRLICLNGATVDEFGQRKNHVGRASTGDESYEIFTDKTLQLDDAAFWAKVTDTVTASLNEAQVGMIFKRLRGSAENKITGSPEVVVKELAKRFSFSEEQSTGILRGLIDGGMGLNQWALGNAVTALANTTKDYDEASRLETMGGKVFTLPPSEWSVLSQAA